VSGPGEHRADRIDDDNAVDDATAWATRAPAGGSVPTRWSPSGTAAVLALATVAMLLVGFLIGFAVRGAASRGPHSQVSEVPALDSVEAGFARDMIAHHDQGISMAHYGEVDSDDPEVARLAYDINSTQLVQVGQMEGWLALWQLPEQVIGPRMTWMTSSGHEMPGMNSGATAPTTAATPSATGTAADPGHQALMPGMATSGEMDRLKSLHGKDSDIYFLQLMVRHHQGGKLMMDDAVAHASNPVVANFAGKMLETQTSEVAVMTQLLDERGAKPLAFTATG
jgi:uncharacterized protein (DUF305 family)